MTIEESDGLIRTFNALLMIARAESGEARENMTEFDAAEVAPRRGRALRAVADDGLDVAGGGDPGAVNGNRELVSQALANLLDNAIKYAAPPLLRSTAPGMKLW